MVVLPLRVTVKVNGVQPDVPSAVDALVAAIDRVADEADMRYSCKMACRCTARPDVSSRDPDS
jgi:hypothetical protein